MLEQGAGRRLVPGALIVLAHVLFFLALLRHTGARVDTDSTPADYIAFAFIPAPTKPVQKASSAAPAVVVPKVPPRRVPASVAPLTSLPVIDTRQISTPAAPMDAAPAPAGKLDMASLRNVARQIDSERASTEGEPLRARDDTILGRAIEKAKRPDCQTKYAGGEKANLLILIPLAIETITDKGCKW